mgnify:CR=1 FL=1
MSYSLMFLINLIPGCKFRVDEEGEIIGVDEVEVRLLSHFSESGDQDL